MVKAVVGANWGDEGKGKITDMLAQEADIIVRFQEVPTQGIPLLIIMGNLRFTHYHPVCSMDIQQVLSVMVWHLIFLY